jgi:hypothetical protein
MRAIFIGGHPRSGTTLLGAMLGAHSACICTPESQFKIRVHRHFENRHRPVDLDAARAMIEKHWRFKLWGLDLDLPPLAEPASYADLLFSLAREYAAQEGKPHARCWVDHTPSNLRHASTLRRLFPASQLIHIVRDGRAVAASIMPLDWGPNTICSAAHSWADAVSQALETEMALGRDAVKRVRYEALVREPEAVLRELCEWLDLEYESAMREARGFVVPAYTAGQHALLGGGADPARIAAWEQALSPRQIEIFESIAGDLLQALGYRLTYGAQARGVGRFERLRFAVEETWRSRINVHRQRRRQARGVAAAWPSSPDAGRRP